MLQSINNYTYLISIADISALVDISPNIDTGRLNVQIKNAQDLDLRLFMGDAFYWSFINYIQNTGFATANIITATTSAANGTYTNVSITSTTGTGSGAKATFVVSGGVVTSVTQTIPGSGFAVGDTFTCASVPGAVFSVNAVMPVFLPTTPPIVLQLFNGGEYNDLQGNPIYYQGMIPAIVYLAFARFIEFDPIQYTTTGPVIKHRDLSDSLRPSDLSKIVASYRSIANAHINNIEKFLYVNKGQFPLWKVNERNKNSRQPGARIRPVDVTQNGRIDYRNYNGLEGWYGN